MLWYLNLSKAGLFEGTFWEKQGGVRLVNHSLSYFRTDNLIHITPQLNYLLEEG